VAIRLRALGLPLAVVLAASPALVGCGGDSSQQAAYCVTQSGQVVDPSYCDSGYSGNDALLYYLLLANMGGSHTVYHVGQTIPPAYRPGGRYGGTYVNPRSPSARASAGLPRTGTVKPGTTVKPPAAKPNTGGGAKPGGGVKPAPRPPAPAPRPAPRPPAPPPPRR
jgi:hypothetical protein